jgi:hypothetical protein
MTRRLEATPARLTIGPWSDSVIEAHGHRPGSAYIEAVWLGVLGPSATWAYQRLARLAVARPGTSIDTVDLATSLGLGHNLGPNAMISRTLNRLVGFGAAVRNDSFLAVRLALPDLPARRVALLSPSARLAHQHLATHHLPTQARAAAPYPSPPAPWAPAVDPVSL